MNIILGCQQQFEAVITEVLSGKDHCRLIFMPFSHSLLLIMLKPMPYFVKRRNVKLWSWRPWSITCYQSAGPPSRVPAQSPESPRWGSCMLWVALIATKVEVLLILCKCHSISFPYKNNLALSKLMTCYRYIKDEVHFLKKRNYVISVSEKSHKNESKLG